MYNINLGFDTGGTRHDLLMSVGNPQLHPGVGQHGLHLTVAVRNHDLVGGTLLLQGDSSVNTSGGPARAWFATFTYADPLYLRPMDIDNEGPIVAAVTDEQLWRIEDLRRGDDFQIDLRINAVLIYQGRTYSLINRVPYPVRVDRDQWLRQLANVQRAAHFMVAVPAVGDGADGMASVVRSLREADAAYRDNRDRDAATAVRRAMERFKTLITLPSARSIEAVDRQQRDEHQRWAAVYHALLDVLHAAAHGDEVTEKVEFSRRDGQAVIAIAMALIGRTWS